MSSYFHKSCIMAAIMLAVVISGKGQNTLPDVFKQGTISEQLQYLEEHTRIYDNYRAIREDMYRTVSRNILDSLSKTKAGISRLNLQTFTLENRIDSLSASLEAANDKLTRATRTKNSIRVLGIEVNKTAYNSVAWTIMAALLFILVAGYLSFRRNRAVTLKTKKDLADSKEEFEAYRQKVRIEREKTNLEHFNEIKKLKGIGPNRG
jgi:hypothetical protein